MLITVLDRLFAPGSDRAAEKWKDAYTIEGAGGLDLHHLYGAMAGWERRCRKTSRTGPRP